MLTFYSVNREILNSYFYEYDQYCRGMLDVKQLDYKQEFNKYRVGDMVSLKNVSGVYEIIGKVYHRRKIRLSCKKWRTLYGSQLRDKPYRDVNLNDINRIIENKI